MKFVNEQGVGDFGGPEPKVKNSFKSAKDADDKRSSAQAGFRSELKELMSKYYNILGNHGIIDAFESFTAEMKESDNNRNSEMIKSFDDKFKGTTPDDLDNISIK